MKYHTRTAKKQAFTELIKITFYQSELTALSNLLFTLTQSVAVSIRPYLALSVSINPYFHSLLLNFLLKVAQTAPKQLVPKTFSTDSPRAAIGVNAPRVNSPTPATTSAHEVAQVHLEPPIKLEGAALPAKAAASGALPPATTHRASRTPVVISEHRTVAGKTTDAEARKPVLPAP